MIWYVLISHFVDIILGVHFPVLIQFEININLLTSLLEWYSMYIFVFWYNLFMKMSEYNFVVFIFTFDEHKTMVSWCWMTHCDVDFLSIGDTVEIFSIVLEVSNIRK